METEPWVVIKKEGNSIHIIGDGKNGAKCNMAPKNANLTNDPKKATCIACMPDVPLMQAPLIQRQPPQPKEHEKVDVVAPMYEDCGVVAKRYAKKR